MPIRNQLSGLTSGLNDIKGCLLKKSKFEFDKYYHISYIQKEEEHFNIYEIVTMIHPFLWVEAKRRDGFNISILDFQGISEQDYTLFNTINS